MERKCAGLEVGVGVQVRADRDPGCGPGPLVASGNSLNSSEPQCHMYNTDSELDLIIVPSQQS